VQYEYPSESKPERPPVVAVSERTLATLREGMRWAIPHSNGTGYAPFQPFVRTEVAGKTGTDEKDDDSWFTSYAPYGDARIVVTVFVGKGGHGSAGAALAAKRIYEAAFDEQGNLLVDLAGS